MLIVFDFDGTLVDSQFAIIKHMQKAFHDEELQAPDDEEIRQTIGLNLQSAIGRLLNDGDQALIEILSSHYTRHARAFQQSLSHHQSPLYPNVKNLLQHLTLNGSTLAIATGMGRKSLDYQLQHHHIEKYFTMTQSADDGPGKPNPTILQNIMDTCCFKASETIMIGDTTFDMHMATNANVHALGVAWGNHTNTQLYQAGAAIVVEQMFDIATFIENLTNKQNPTLSQC